MLTCPACARANPAEASFCMGCGGPLGATATAHEVRKTVTALFCDLVGSTTLGERYDPEVLRPLLHAYFEQMRAAVERHGGRVEKFIGDAVNAVFGLPVAHEDDALRAVRAAMEMTERVAGLAADGPIPLACRIGVNTGEVLVPAHGEPLIGDAMNTAARLQANAQPGSVLIGEPTWRLVRDAVVAEPLEVLILKGKAAPVAAYLVRRVASGSPMRARRLDAPMVGRARESALLVGAFERAASDRACQLFTVLGTAGAGKSRLVEEFLAGRTDAEILRGRCLSYGDGITWYPVTEALRGALGFPEFAEADAIRSAIGAAVAGEEHASALVANLAPLFAVGPGGTAEETAWAIRRFLESRGREHPLVLVLDDIHWGEPAFLDLVEHVADWSRDASILLLCMARPDLLDVRPGWGGGKTNATTISLAPLSGTETDALLDGLLGSSALPPEVRARITQVAEGNPLFVEEMLRMLVDDGRLVRDEGNGGWTAAGDLSRVAVPPTVSALLSARLDRLSDGERAVVEAAAIAGQAFHRGSVAALLPEAAGADLATHFRSLTRKEVITPERSALPGEDAYRFRHLLIRDAAYDAIPKSARCELHRAFADWLEGVAGERIAEQQEIVAHHLERAHRYREELGLPEDQELRLRAARALGATGVRALDAGEVQAAGTLLRSAADLSQGDRIQLEILSRLIEALFDQNEIDEARAVTERLEAAATTARDPVYDVRARLIRWSIDASRNPGRFDAQFGRDLVAEAVRTVRNHGAEQLMPWALRWTADMELESGSAAGMLRALLESLEVARSRNDRRSVRNAIGLAAEALVTGPTPLLGVLEHIESFRAEFRGDRAIEAVCLMQLAFVSALLGRTMEAREAAAAGQAIMQELGYHLYEVMPSVIDAMAAWSTSATAEAERLLRQAVSWSEAHTDPEMAAYCAILLARVHLDQRRVDIAERDLTALRDMPSIWATRIHTPSIAAVVAARRGDADTAFRLSAEAEAVVAATDFVNDQGDVALDKAEIRLLAGRPDEARASAEDALARFERKEYAIGIRRARAFLATLDAAPGTKLA